MKGENMADILIRNIDENTLKNLKKRAKSNNHSLQAELKSLLEMHGRTDIEETRNMVKDILENYRAEGRIFPDSVDDIREDRER